MNVSRARRGSIILLAVLVLGSLTGCKTVRVGARCSPNEGFAQSGNYVMTCQKGRWTRWRTKQQAAQLLMQILQARAKPAVGEVVRPQSLGSPQLPGVSDPSVLVQGPTTYVYSTRTFRRLPVRTLTSVDATYDQNAINALTTEAMPQRVPWASDDEVWAPTVANLNGQFVAFFAARRQNPPDAANPQCIGRATSASPTGPFVADASPIFCGNDGHGALDPEVFITPDGHVHLLAALGGSNTNIWSMPLDGFGNIAGPPIALLARTQPWEDWFLENPSMMFDGGVFVLAYSAGRWETGAYMTGIARCASPAGPCTSSPVGPWLSSIGPRTGPGGLTFFVGSDGAARVAFHTYPAGSESASTPRATHVQRVFFDPWPRLPI